MKIKMRTTTRGSGAGTSMQALRRPFLILLADRDPYLFRSPSSTI